MAYRFKTALRHSDVTPKAVWLNRRALLAGGVAAGAALALPADARSRWSTDETPNPKDHITRYNNFYEFGSGKEDPSQSAKMLTTKPWTLTIDGLVDRPGDYDLAELTEGLTIEERIYRLRCVEAWSMVIPWMGFELGALLARVGVQPAAKYVAFETLYRPEEMPMQRTGLLDWPYREGLRLDEAMHPLTIMATGLYGEALPNQNGAPIRLVVPWKYGFKSIKSVTRISLTETEPRTTWNMMGSDEYGFYANVNPEVDHPRWSQATERRIGGGFLASRQPTLLFNGYADEVAALYAGMDLAKFY